MLYPITPVGKLSEFAAQKMNETQSRETGRHRMLPRFVDKKTCSRILPQANQLQCKSLSTMQESKNEMLPGGGKCQMRALSPKVHGLRLSCS